MKNFQIILFILLTLIVVDLFLNGGRVMATIAASANGQAAIITSLDNQNLVNSMPPAPRTVTIDTSQPATVTFNEPAIIPLEPAQPTQQPEAVIDYAETMAQPTREYTLTDDQLAACIQAQQTGRRLAPYCPPNPAEYAGVGR